MHVHVQSAHQSDMGQIVFVDVSVQMAGSAIRMGSAPAQVDIPENSFCDFILR